MLPAAPLQMVLPCQWGQARLAARPRIGMAPWQVVFEGLSDGSQFMLAVVNMRHRLPGEIADAGQSFRQRALCNILRQARASAESRGEVCGRIAALGHFNLPRSALQAVLAVAWPANDGVFFRGEDMDFVLAPSLSYEVQAESLEALDHAHRSVSARVTRRGGPPPEGLPRQRPGPAPAATAGQRP